MQKNVLIIGTSHSACQCDGKIYTYGRWHDFFKTDFGWETTVLSEPGTTAQKQLLSLINYLNDNPEKTWDMCIIEGRCLENIINVPDDNNMETTVIHENAKYHKQIYPWAVPYVYSVNQCIDNCSANLAMIELLSKVCTTTKMWVWYRPDNYRDGDEFVTHRKIENKLLGNHFLFEDYYSEVTSGMPHEYKCKCGHANQNGNEWIWKKSIKPEVMRLLGDQYEENIHINN